MDVPTGVRTLDGDRSLGLGLLTCMLVWWGRCSKVLDYCSTPKGQSAVSLFERFPFYRGRYDDVTFKTPVTVKDVKTGPLSSVLLAGNSKRGM